MNETKELIFQISYFATEMAIVAQTTRIKNAKTILEAIQKFEELFPGKEIVGIVSSKLLH